MSIKKMEEGSIIYHSRNGDTKLNAWRTELNKSFPPLSFVKIGERLLSHKFIFEWKNIVFRETRKILSQMSQSNFKEIIYYISSNYNITTVWQTCDICDKCDKMWQNVTSLSQRNALYYSYLYTFFLLWQKKRELFVNSIWKTSLFLKFRKIQNCDKKNGEADDFASPSEKRAGHLPGSISK